MPSPLRGLRGRGRGGSAKHSSGAESTAKLSQGSQKYPAHHHSHVALALLHTLSYDFALVILKQGLFSYDLSTTFCSFLLRATRTECSFKIPRSRHLCSRCAAAFAIVDIH